MKILNLPPSPSARQACSCSARGSLLSGLASALCAVAGILPASAQQPAAKVNSAQPQSVPTSVLKASTTSASKQFVIYGGDLILRGTFAVISEDVSAALVRLLKDDTPFVIPTVIVLKTPPDIVPTGPTVSTTITQMEPSGFHLQVNLQLRPDFRAEDFRREMVRILLAERILRNHKQLLTKRQRVLPDWVLTGVNQALEFRDRSRPSALFAAVFRSGQVYSIDKIFTADDASLDALSRAVYETSACALVLTLLDQPDGPMRLRKFLSLLATDSSPDRDLLKECFPTFLASQNSLEKWWTLQMASLATPGALEAMSVNQTEANLDDALTLRVIEHSKDAEGAKGKETSADDFILPGPSIWNLLTGSRPVSIFSIFKGKDNSDGSDADPKDKDKRPAVKVKTDKDKGQDKAKVQDKTQGREKEKDKDKDKKDHPAPPSKNLPPPPKLEPKAPPALATAPKPPPPAPSQPAKPAATEAATEAQPKHNPLNPLNWFRKNKPETADSAKDKSKSDNDRNKNDNSHLTTLRPREPALPTPKRLPGVYGLEDYSRIWQRKNRVEILQDTMNRLSELKVSCHPLYKSLIGDYQEVVQKLIAGKKSGVNAKLDVLQTRRARVHEQAQSVESYVDWYQASETQELSGLFDDYLKLRRQFDEAIPNRTDEISKYLDALEKEYED